MDKKFVIVSDSCCDLSEELRKQYDVEYLPMYVSYENNYLPADLDWKNLSAKEFYDLLRSGTRVFTSQVPPNDYIERFEKYIKDGYDILSISCSSALSASVKASKVARDTLSEKYPQSKIICIDSLISSFGLGLLCILASKLRADGYAIEQVAEEIENTKSNVNQLGTVNELKFLKRAGRISATKAFFGTVMSVKPIIISNTKGENVSIENTKGRKSSVRRLAEMTTDKFTGEKLNEIFITHGDCLEDAETLKALILQNMPNAKITIGMLNPIMGASCGPNMLGVYFIGQEKPNTD